MLCAMACMTLWETGCSRSGAPGDRPIKIVYWTRGWWGDPAQYQDETPIPVPEWQKQQIARFEAAHPGVEVDLQVDPGGRGDKIRLAFAGGVPPDVFHIKAAASEATSRVGSPTRVAASR